MSSREFAFHQVVEDGQPRMAATIVCACGNRDTFVNQARMQLAPAAPARWFTEKGWHVGSKPKGDKCPYCRALSASSIKLKLVPKEEPVSQTPAPKEMTREDRGVIFAKLGDVYQGKGYVAGWTDTKVAEDLNVPLLWVREVRDLFYGTDAGNPEIEELLAKTSLLRTEVDAGVLQSKHLLESLKKTYEGLDARLIELERLAKKVAKEIGR